MPATCQNKMQLDAFRMSISTPGSPCVEKKTDIGYCHVLHHTITCQLNKNHTLLNILSKIQRERKEVILEIHILFSTSHIAEWDKKTNYVKEVYALCHCLPACVAILYGTIRDSSPYGDWSPFYHEIWRQSLFDNSLQVRLCRPELIMNLGGTCYIKNKSNWTDYTPNILQEVFSRDRSPSRFKLLPQIRSTVFKEAIGNVLEDGRSSP